MDGFTSAGVAGILYAEDFDAPPAARSAAPPPVVWDIPAAPVGLTEADLDAACIRAVAAAERSWSEGAAERRTLALEAIGAGLAEARREAAMAAETVADGLARAMLGMLAALLPELCRRHGDAEVRALLRRLLPLVGRTGGVVVRLHAGLLDMVAGDLAALDPDLADTVELRAANLPEGDVRLSWPDGGLVRDTAALRATVNDCLSQLGLTDTILESRSPAHALAH